MNELAVAWVAGGSAIVSAALSAVVTLIVQRRPARAAEVTASAAVQQAINDGFAELAGGWKVQVDELRGEIRNLTQHVESLEAVLRANGIPVPSRPPRTEGRELVLIPGGIGAAG